MEVLPILTRKAKSDGVVGNTDAGGDTDCVFIVCNVELNVYQMLDREKGMGQEAV